MTAREAKIRVVLCNETKKLECTSPKKKWLSQKAEAIGLVVLKPCLADKNNVGTAAPLVCNFTNEIFPLLHLTINTFQPKKFQCPRYININLSSSKDNFIVFCVAVVAVVAAVVAAFD